MSILLKKTACILGTAMMVTMIFTAFPFVAEAKDQTINLNGQVYEFDKKSEYEIDSSSSDKTTDEITTLGSWSISGNIANNYTKDGIPAYEIEDDTIFSISYKYSSKLKNASSMDWHLIEDNKKTVNGVALDEKIKNGAIILQTSLDANKWTTGKVITNAASNTTFKRGDGINDIQLANGCYYRIIVAYEIEKQLDDKNILFIDTSKYEQKKNAEVYEFFASYKNEEMEVSGKKYIYYAGTKDGNSYTVRTKKNDYVGSAGISDKDPHYGWNLGEFCLSGYTDIGDSKDIYLKTVGNKIKLSFKLEQDIACLNGNENLIIKNDKKGFDGDFKKQPHDMGHGELLIKHTNEEGAIKIREYSDYLEALASPGADTIIQLFEEGDYEVHLDYAITDKDGWDSTTYYRTSFKFKIRNGNCMVYIFDAKSGAELNNGDTAENGFRIDTAKSSYPKLTIKKEIMNKTKNGLVEDTRFNRAAMDGEVFTDEGIYTITAHNRFDSSLEPAVKTIYIGDDILLKAYTKHLDTSEQYTIEQLSTMVNDEGYTITDTGDIVESKKETTSASTQTTTATNDKKETPNFILFIAIGGVGLAILIIIIALRHKKKKSQ